MSKDIFEIINPTNTLGVCRPLAHILGACETIVYNALLSKYRYYQKNDMLDDGWFYSTIPDLFESTSFSAFRQKRCITTLESFGLIETKNRGLPARRSFRIINDLELIAKLVAKGEEIMRSAKIEAALSYEKKRKHSDESDLSESSYTDEEEETVLFTLFVLFQLFNAFNCRELDDTPMFKNLLKNKLMLGVFLLVLILQGIITQFGAAVFETVPLSAAMWGKMLLTAFTVIILNEGIKAVKRLFVRK